MKRLVPIMAAALAITACGARPADENSDMGNHGQASTARYENVFRLPVLPGRPGGGYLSIAVPADHGALVSVTSPQAGRIEMHETSQAGGVTRMRQIQRIAPEDGQLVLMPRGRHLMLFDIGRSLAAGDTARLVLRFEGGQTMMLEARVIAGEDAHAGH